MKKRIVRQQIFKETPRKEDLKEREAEKRSRLSVQCHKTVSMKIYTTSYTYFLLLLVAGEKKIDIMIMMVPHSYIIISRCQKKNYIITESSRIFPKYFVHYYSPCFVIS